MSYSSAFTDVMNFFNEMIKLAYVEYNKSFSKSLELEKKADKSFVTQFDKKINTLLSHYAAGKGFKIISKEGQHLRKVVKSGSYITINPIDGTRGYIKHINTFKCNPKIYNKKLLGPLADHCLLLGIVKHSQPLYACCYNYVTDENIFLDGIMKRIVFEGKRIRSLLTAKNACYTGTRTNDNITREILADKNITQIMLSPFGLRALLVQIGNHENAITVHHAQQTGLWDVLPACVASKITGGTILDDTGHKVILNKYIMLPGKGATSIKGKKFIGSIKNILRQKAL